jgi:hypothetical protein
MRGKDFGASIATLSILTLVLSAVSAQAQQIQWKRIVGNQQTFVIVGVDTGQVTGGAPWTTTGGMAKVYLTLGKVGFQVLRISARGWQCACGSAFRSGHRDPGWCHSS